MPQVFGKSRSSSGWFQCLLGRWGFAVLFRHLPFHGDTSTTQLWSVAGSSVYFSSWELFRHLGFLRLGRSTSPASGIVLAASFSTWSWKGFSHRCGVSRWPHRFPVSFKERLPSGTPGHPPRCLPRSPLLTCRRSSSSVSWTRSLSFLLCARFASLQRRACPAADF